MSLDVLIVGGGISGLVCARSLHEAGFKSLILEASDDIGGRVRTDVLDGFRLDRGFQVLLTSYPEAQTQLDYSKLNLCRFEPGALIYFDGKLNRFSDPWRRPSHALATAISPVATLHDKLAVARFRSQTVRGELQSIYHVPEQPTVDLLRSRGFSDVVMKRFFRPFLGGVFLDPQLQTSSRLCQFVFRMFSQGDAALPSSGMGEIGQQLAGRLPAESIRTQTRVEAIEGQEVVLDSGERLSAPAIVVATEAPVARRLLNDPYPASGRSVKCLYFAANRPPIEEPILVLNGEGRGPINNLCVPSQVARHYAPDGQSLVSVTVLESWNAEADELVQAVRSQLGEWFGADVESWRHLRTYAIEYALPTQSPPALEPVEKPCSVRTGLFVCGDHCDTASINGAMASGRRAAQAAMSQLGATAGG